MWLFITALTKILMGVYFFFTLASPDLWDGNIWYKWTPSSRLPFHRVSVEAARKFKWGQVTPQPTLQGPLPCWPASLGPDLISYPSDSHCPPHCPTRSTHCTQGLCACYSLARVKILTAGLHISFSQRSFQRSFEFSTNTTCVSFHSF